MESVGDLRRLEIYVVGIKVVEIYFFFSIKGILGCMELMNFRKHWRFTILCEHTKKVSSTCQNQGEGFRLALHITISSSHFMKKLVTVGLRGLPIAKPSICM